MLAVKDRTVDGNNTVLIFRQGCKSEDTSCLRESQKKRNILPKMITIPKLLKSQAVLHSERGPAKCACAAWSRDNSPSLCWVTPKAKSSCSQGQPALRQVPRKVPTTGLTVGAQEWFCPFEFGPKEALPL